MRPSRWYQTGVQIIGSLSEIILFFGGFFLGKGMFIVAFGLILFRMTNKIIISELMYRRSKMVVREELSLSEDEDA